MAYIDYNALQDLLATTLRDLPQGEFEATWDYPYYVFNKVLSEKKREIDGGTVVQRNIIFDEDGSARWRSMFDTDQPAVSQNQFTITVPFVQCSSNYSWDIVELLANKNSDVGFINLLKSRKVRAMWSLANLIEQGGWSLPQTQADALRPFGVPYWLSFAPAGTAAGVYGFNGSTARYANGSTSTIIGGIDAAQNAKWQSFTAVYNRLDNSLLQLLRTAVRQTRFEPPSYVETPGDDKWGDGAAFYTSNDIITALENLGDLRDDDNKPKDLVGALPHNDQGVIYFNRMPFMYVKPLDTQQVTSTVGANNGKLVNPGAIYCIDWSKLQCIVREGLWMVDSHPIIDRGQHTAFTVFTDCSFQIIGLNRRTLGFTAHLAI
jgi:hypothetical protein